MVRPIVCPLYKQLPFSSTLSTDLPRKMAFPTAETLQKIYFLCFVPLRALIFESQTSIRLEEKVIT